jgi:Domain of unknown function (DUF4424)
MSQAGFRYAEFPAEVSMRLFLLPALLVATPLLANDGFGGLSATGLTFGQTDAVAMEEERLFISKDKVTVDYVFRNITSSDVTGEVIFPLPPIPANANLESSWNLPEDAGRDNLVNFTATVDGVDVPVTVDRIAVLEAPWEEGRPLAEQYDAPGRDVTADLVRLGIPLTVDVYETQAALMALDPARRAEIEALGLAEFVDTAASTPDYAYPLWSVILRYHWTQTFPAGQEVRISHAYENRSAGGLFGWSHPPEDYMQPVTDQYCIDNSTSRAMAKVLEQKPTDGEVFSMGLSWNIAYVLRTANSWAGPIGKFTLTLDKGAPENLISLCADGVKKTGPTTFVVEKTNFTPDRDLEILIVEPMSWE